MSLAQKKQKKKEKEKEKKKAEVLSTKLFLLQ
jgi:hypothetical protein